MVREEKTPKVKSITLLSTYMESFKRPSFPMIDAGIFNAKTDKLASQIKKAQIESLAKYQKIVQRGLAGIYKCQIKTTDDLKDSDKFLILIKKYRNDSTLFNYNKLTFTQTYTAPNEINLLDLKKGNFKRYFNKKKNYSDRISEIFNYIDTEYLAISYSKLYISNVGSFGIKGTIKLETNLLLFDRSGQLVARSFHHSPNQRIKGSQLSEYTDALDKFDVAFSHALKKNYIDFKRRRK
jgi:hypothetical protein